ncbi:hypothetical protein MZD04_gp272 [Pseudomonas phage Psa21]|uniref:Uncharacterized protein n=1 Tax=Pseudomonas phage Psa21 TaxID=2530023 RepID=A0A481W521_9CAUD|nr:hypothetical protein MZD04_gp272 [Pseudomonas phage Psa21]QBJ02798.1 hypothetical protein PSA21_272 [Pseudomonas phage Psa21]
MSHNPMSELHQQQITGGTNPLTNISVSSVAGKVSFGTEADPTEVYQDWPARFHVLDSVDFLTYEQVLKAFTDEDTWFKLDAVHDAINEAGQRLVNIGYDDDIGTAVKRMTVSLPGIMPPDVLKALYEKVRDAGHLLYPVRRMGIDSTTFTVFTIVPGYAALAQHSNS